MKNKSKRVLTFITALVMCAGMIITDLQAADLGAGGADPTAPVVEEAAPDNDQEAEEGVQVPDTTVPEPPVQEAPKVEEPQIQQPQIQQPAQQNKQRSKTAAEPLDDNLAALMSGQATAQTMSVTAGAEALAEAKKSAENAALLVPLDMKDGSIVLSKGGYKQGDKPANVQSDETYTIMGGSDKDNIVVESGANPTITLKGVNLNLTGATGLSAIDIAPGASVTLILDGNSSLTGAPVSSAIRLQDRSAVSIKGSGTLTLIGGQGAYAAANNDQAAGNFGVLDEAAKVAAYSNITGEAINVQNMYTNVKILQGSLDIGIVDKANSKGITIENRNKRDEEIYKLTLPIGYASFSTTTTIKGGEYVAYFPDATGKIANSELLADASGKYVYGLETLFTASLEGLKPKAVMLSVTFDANTGAFGNGQKKIIVTDIGYGTAIGAKAPGKPEKKNNTPEDWYLDADGNNKWDIQNMNLVKDTVLYINWIPKNCTVSFVTNTSPAVKLEPEVYPYKEKIPSNSKVHSVSNGDYTLDGWYTDKGVKWDFDNDVLTKEYMVLSAKWLAPCKVTFNKNAADAVNISPDSVTVPASTSVRDPSSDKKEPTRVGYRFTGWYTTAQCVTAWNFDDKVTKSMTLYAGWAAEKTTVTFEPGVDAKIEKKEISVDDRDTIPKPPEKSVTKKPRQPDADGNMGTEYVMVGWYTDAKFTNEWDFSKPLRTPDGKLTLYAKWRQEVCWYTLNPNDPDATLAPNAHAINKVPYDAKLTEEDISKTFIKKGHTIASWKRGANVWNFDTALTEDIVLSANWTPEKYNVKFNVEEAEGIPKLDTKDESQTVIFNNPVTKPIYPKTGDEWPGHTFNGWFTQPEGAGVPWIFRGDPDKTPSLVEGDTELYAYWTWDEYALTWDYKDGINTPVTEEKIYRYGDAVVEPVVPTRENYIFQGWYTDQTYTEESKWDFETSTMKGNTTLYAKWIGEQKDLILHITYESAEEGGDGKVVTQEPVKVRYGDFLKREDLEKDTNKDTKPRLGYTLKGWYKDKEHTEEWKFETDMIEKNHTLYAYWTRNVYKISFFTYEGDSNKIEDQTSYHELPVKKPTDPARQHYSFDAWYTDDTYAKAWDFKNDTVSDNMTLYAKWIPDIYKLSFETNGGSKLEPIDVTYGTYPPDEALATKKEGYVIKAWYRDKAMTIPFDPKKDLVDGNMSLYTEWKLEEYKVKFHYMAAKDSQEEELIEDEEVYNVGNYVTAPTLTKEHKKLSGWYQDPQFKERWVFKRDTIKGNLDLYAYWSDVEYTVHFETYDGTVIEDKKQIWGSLIEKPADAERNGYTFTGWFKDSSQEEPWDFENDFVEGDTTIYAGWNPNMYEIAFDLNGGTGTVTAQKLLFGSYIAKPEDPTKEGNTFKGWKMNAKTRAAEGDIWNFASDTVNGDIMLTAQWEEIKTPDNGNTDNGNTNNGNTNNGNTNNGNGSTGGTTTGGTTGGTNTTSGTGTNSTTNGTGGTTTAAADAIKSAAGAVGSILTGDKAPLTYSLVGIFVGAFMIIWTLIRKYK